MPAVALANEQVYQLIRERLVQGQGSTTRGLSHRKLANELGVGLSRIRTVLTQLERDGLVESRPRSGTRLRQPDATEYHELFDMRELIEAYAARRAAWWITPEQLKRIDASCDAADREVAAFLKACPSRIPEKHIQRYMEIELTFHGTILEAARNKTASRMLDNFRLLTYAMSYSRIGGPERHAAIIPRSAREHRAIARALRDGKDAEAERLMREHLSLGRWRDYAGLPPAELRQLQMQ